MTDYMTRLNGVYASGQKWSCGFRVTSGQDLPTLSTTMSNAWQAAWTDGTHGLKLIYPAGTNMSGVTVAALDGAMKFTQRQFTPNAQVGASGGTSVGYASGIVVSLRSPGTKKWQRGRFKLPAPDPQFVTDDILQNTPAAHVKAAVKSVMDAVRADGSTIFVCGLKDHKLLPGTAFVKTIITLDPLIATKLGTQRNRTKGLPTAYV